MAEETSAGAETVIKMTETSNSRLHTARCAVLTPLSGRSGDELGNQPSTQWQSFIAATRGHHQVHAEYICVSPPCFRLSEVGQAGDWSGPSTGRG